MLEPVPIPNEQQAEPNKKRHLNVMLLGHAGSGKTTTIRKLSVVERVGRSFFETESRRFTVLDIPACKKFQKEMYHGVLQADICVLVISARRGEKDRAFFEDFWLPFPASGKVISEEQKEMFRTEILGQTRDYVELAKNLGVSKLIVPINKMDDPTVNWSKERYEFIQHKMVNFLERTGYDTEKDVLFLPMSALCEINTDKRMPENVCNWGGDHPCFFDALDSVEVPLQDDNGPLRMLITDVHKREGTVIVEGKVDSGRICVGDPLVIMPIQEDVKVTAIHCSGVGEVMQAGPLEFLTVDITGAEEMDIQEGSFLCSSVNLVPTLNQFVARLRMDKRLCIQGLVTAGHQAIIHIHGFRGVCEINEILYHVDPATNKRMRRKGCLRSGDVCVCRIKLNTYICADKFKNSTLLGRFVIRQDDGNPFATGKVIYQ